MKNRILLISLTVVLALSMGLIGCGGEQVPETIEYSLTTSSTEGGSVINPGEGTLIYDEGTVVNLVAEADEGYQFVSWTGDVDTVDDVNAASTNITMDRDCSITANFTEGVVVAFADPNLEVAIREAIGKPIGEIYESDLLGLTSLDTTQRKIMNLGGLEHCTSLTNLDLGDNAISDISTLAGLTSLTELYLWNNQISDISALANLTSLATLNLWGNYIGDISALAGLTSLTNLDLGNNDISDISTLAGLTNLTYLSLDNNDISDISTLAGLTSLAYLFLPYNQISNISPLSNLTGLLQLDLMSNQIIDISSLANLASLEFLVLERNQIIDILALVDNEGLSEWDWVLLTDNPLSSDSVNIYIPQLEARGVTVTLHH